MIYGHDKTIHRTETVDVEIDPTTGEVVAVWFRCALLPFSQSQVSRSRADDMRAAYKHPPRGIVAIEFADDPARLGREFVHLDPSAKEVRHEWRDGAERATTLTDGTPVTPDHRDIVPRTGMQKAYVVLSKEERAKGFVRPVRQKYKHKTCGTTTTMGLAIAETYARDPKFYSATFCVSCRQHFPLVEFVWDGTDEQVGS